jgi:EAL domain-containing protein (putative c-di-GMP-specific phosphodiesterase class I)
LRDLPVTEAKIDKTFVTRAAAEWRTQRIILAMVELAHDLGITVVAEGIETELARAAAAEVGCDKGQGYLYGRPIPASGIEAIVNAQSLFRGI